LNIDSFDELVAHVGHNVIVVGYGREEQNQYVHVALECETCGRVLFEWDRPTEPGGSPTPRAPRSDRRDEDRHIADTGS
jgi:hypothetical protein